MATDPIPRFTLSGGRRHDPQVEAWLSTRPAELAVLAGGWIQRLRDCGDDVLELMHDGQATACVGEVAFAYVGIYARHVSVGFFRGAELSDPLKLLEGNGKLMRHVKLWPNSAIDAPALGRLIQRAYSAASAPAR
ncbi:MAG: DUF1801 domain-containing protein [Xanthomonadales bacterium]|nr:DUF1801 domain-containing protein [Xanthomonadales bacterium]